MFGAVLVAADVRPRELRQANRQIDICPRIISRSHSHALTRERFSRNVLPPRTGRVGHRLHRSHRVCGCSPRQATGRLFLQSSSRLLGSQASAGPPHRPIPEERPRDRSRDRRRHLVVARNTGPWNRDSSDRCDAARCAGKAAAGAVADPSSPPPAHRQPVAAAIRTTTL